MVLLGLRKGWLRRLLVGTVDGATSADARRELLRSVARPEVAAALPPMAASADLRGLGPLACAHGVAGYVVGGAAAASLPEAEQHLLARQVRTTVYRYLASMLDLRFLHRTLDAAALPWLLLKGPSLTRVHGAAMLRTYGDLDVLVHGAALRDVICALEGGGAQVFDRNWTLIRRAAKGEVHLELPSGSHLDLHWHLINDQDRRQAFTIPLEQLLDDAVDLDLDGTSARVLHPADEICYVALHALLSGAHRLVWLKDVERLLHHVAVPAGSIADRARSWGVALPLAMLLHRIDRCLGLPPAGRELLTLLPEGRAWQWVGQQVWQRVPATIDPSARSPARLVARSTRPTTGSSVGTLVRRSTGVWRPDRAPIDDEAGTLPSEHPGSGRFPSGGMKEREAYLREVAVAASASSRSTS